MLPMMHDTNLSYTLTQNTIPSSISYILIFILQAAKEQYRPLTLLLEFLVNGNFHESIIDTCFRYCFSLCRSHVQCPFLSYFCMTQNNLFTDCSGSQYIKSISTILPKVVNITLFVIQYIMPRDSLVSMLYSTCQEIHLYLCMFFNGGNDISHAIGQVKLYSDS